MRVLIVGKENVQDQSMSAFFEAHGHSVYSCEAGESAWTLFEQEHPDLVILSPFEVESKALCLRIRAADKANAVIIAALTETMMAPSRLSVCKLDDCFFGTSQADALQAWLTLVERRVQTRFLSLEVKAELAKRVHQQAQVATLGRLALGRTTLKQLMVFAVEAVAKALGVTFCKVLLRVPNQEGLCLEAGVGWKKGYVGEAVVGTGPDSQAGYTLASGVPVIVEDLQTETRFSGPDLLVEHGIISGLSVTIPGEDQPHGVLGAHTTQHRRFHEHDITFLQAVANILADAIARKQAEQALKDSEARTRTILETTVDGIITIDERGCIESFNTAAEKIFGYAAAEVMGRNISVLMPSPYQEEHDSYIQNYQETGHKKIIGIGREVVGQRKDGSIFPMDLAVSELKLGDRQVFTGVVRDITDRRHLEQEILRISEQERRRIGQDLHDGLGQMLTGIGLISQNLARRLNNQDHAVAEEITEVTELVKEADQQARTLARGLIPVDLEATGLSAALRRLAHNAERLFGIRCMLEEVGAVLIHDNAVATHLYRIAQEAVSNAVKHGQAKTVRISLASGEGQLRLRIQDDGIGFPDELDEERLGMGVRIMHYRARIIGATLEIGSGLSGAKVTCTLRRTDQPIYQAQRAVV